MGAAAAVAIGVQLLGSAVSAYGQYQQGKAAKATAKYQAKLSEHQAQHTRFAGEMEEGRLMERGRGIRGAQRAAYAASGVVVDSGSSLDAVLSTEQQIQMDAAMLRYNTEIEASAHMQQAGLHRMGGASAMAGAKMSAAGTLLGGAGRAASMYQGM